MKPPKSGFFGFFLGEAACKEALIVQCLACGIFFIVAVLLFFLFIFCNN